MYLVALMIWTSTLTWADARLTRAMACADSVSQAFTPALAPGVHTFFDPTSRSVLIFDAKLPYRCAVPDAILTCLRTNPKCPRFELWVAAPALTFDAGLSFDGTALGAGFSRQPKGMLDAQGRFTRVLPHPVAPPMALKCVPDRARAVIDAFENRLREIAGAKPSDACSSFAAKPSSGAPAPTNSAPATAR